MSVAAPVKTSVPSFNDVLVPETLLKKRKTDSKLREENQAKALELRKARKQKRSVIFKRAEQYVKEYKALEREQIRLRRLAKSQGNFHVPAQPRVAFVVRLRGISNIPPKPRKIMQLLRLRQINNGVFLKLTNATQQMLQIITPYVAWGEPNLKSIRELLYKRGFAKINRQRIPITDNSVVEKELGKYGIISVEDLVHEIATAGPNFKVANAFLWPFQLSSPTGGFKKRKFLHFNEGGTAGDHESDINRLVRRMN